MIYLFEDRINRMNQYLVNKEVKHAIDEGEYIKLVNFSAEEKEDLNSYIQREFQDANVVLFHGTYIFPNAKFTVSDVRFAFAKNQVDFISFSGGSNTGNYFLIGNHYEGSINSAVMYENLIRLLRNYETTGHPDVRLLFFGEEYLKNELLIFEKLINQYLANYEESTPIAPEDLKFIQDTILDPYLSDPEFESHKDMIDGWMTKKIQDSAHGSEKNNQAKPKELYELINRMKSKIL